MLLLYPPVAKPSEPPAGLALLAGVLHEHNVPFNLFDLNLEGLNFLLNISQGQDDNWSKRCIKNRQRNLKAIRSPELYQNPARYRKVILELNRLLELSDSGNVLLNFANYQDTTLSPVKSSDLLLAAATPEKSLFYSFFANTLPKTLEENNHEFIGISINYLSQALNSFALIGYLKRVSPHSKIIVGGGLITSWMSSPTWNSPFAGLIDHCIKGCGKQPLLSLLNTTKHSKNKPHYTPLKDNQYFAPGFILPYSSSTGCYWNKCNFCPEKAEKAKFNPHSENRVITEIHQLKEETSPILLHFLDNAIPPRLLKRCDGSFPGLPWYGFARVTKELLDLDFCLELQKSGCIMLKLGIESGSQKVLDSMEKGQELDRVSRVLKNLSTAGIATYVYLLFGTPAETYEDAQLTLEFAKQHHKEIGFLNLAIFNMPINSWDEKVIKTAEFYGGDLSLYTNFDHPLGWNRKNVRSFLDKEFKRSPQISTILRRDPPIFTSNHAPLFT